MVRDGVLADVFHWLAGNSSRRLDIIAQYWQLRAHPEDPRSGDYGYSKRDMKKFGAQEGSKVYNAIDTAADRNVSIRYSHHLGLQPHEHQQGLLGLYISSSHSNLEFIAILI